MRDDLDFLQPDLVSIKQSIRDIDDSYSHEWDLIAELCQNSVDAIMQSENKNDGFISIEVDAHQKSLKITDNGIGIGRKDLPRLLRPFSTNKRNDSGTIGEKGVGLTFVIFSGNRFEIRTRKAGEKGVVGSINDAHTWKTGNGTEKLRLDVRDAHAQDEGTQITVSDIPDSPLFNLTFSQLKYVLRTKTALGSTKSIWGSTDNIVVKLKLVDTNGDVHNEELPYRYALPHENLPASAIIDFDDFISFASDPGRTDFDKRSKLRDKVIFRKGEFTHGNSRRIKYVIIFVPQRRTWETLAKSYSLANESDFENEDWLDTYGYLLPTSGIYTSVKGMPTSIAVDHPNTGNAGYWPNTFLLYEDAHLSFDIGRKALPGRQTAMIKEFAKKHFGEITKDIVKYVAGDVPTPSSWDREEILAEIETLAPIDYGRTSFVKSPKDQEASVAGIFYECLGNGTIRGLAPLTSAYKDRYDLVAKWGRKTVFIEFKSHLRNITKDFNDAQKMFDEMDCIVCWDVSETDVQELGNKLAVGVEQIKINPLSRETSIFPNATHCLTLNGFTKPVYVIDMKTVLDASQRT